MKKFVVLSLISFLILAFGATVYSQEKAPTLEFKASGFIDVITEYMVNVPNPGLATTAGGGTWATDVVFNPYRAGGPKNANTLHANTLRPISTIPA